MRNHFLRAAAAAAAEISNAWDIEYASFTGTPKNWLNVGDQETSPRGIFFKPDGTRMYHTGFNGDSVYEYNLSTAWDLSSGTYSQSFSISAQDSIPLAVVLGSNGDKMYVTGNANDAIYEYTLSTNWDISSATYSQAFSISSQDTIPSSLSFKNDGSIMYLLGAGNDSVYQYNLSTAWDISTASYVQSFSVSGQETNPTGLFLKADGTKMYLTGNTGDAIYEYSLSTAWDISTASYIDNLSISGQTTTPAGLFIEPDGTKVFVMDLANLRAFQLYLSTAWDISTGSFSFPSTDYYKLQDALATGLFFKPDGSKMFTSGAGSDLIREYSLSTAWQISSASFTTSFSVSAQDTNPTDLFLKADGTVMYVLGSSNDQLYAYSLSTAWDISSANFNQNFYVAAQAPVPVGLAFKADGLKFYISCSNTDSVHEYDLSTAWDISTASYNQSFSVSSQGSLPQGVEFSNDGLFLYIIDIGSDTFYQYALSTAWDISTASLDTSFQPELSSLYFSSIQSLRFKPDGLKLFVVDSTVDAAWAFTIS